MKYIILTSLLLSFVTVVNAQEWKTVESFAGDGQATTRSFTINEAEWRVVYRSRATDQLLSIMPNGGGHIFSITMKSPNDDSVYELLANQSNKATISGRSYQYLKGRFYFDVSAANGSWTINVQVEE